MTGTRIILAHSLSLPKKRGDRILMETGAHWFRLIVGSAGGMSRMVRWPRKKPDQNNKRRSRRSRSRGLIDRDVFAATPASGGNVDSRLANRRSDRARFARSKPRTLGSRQCAGAVFGSLKLETG